MAQEIQVRSEDYFYSVIKAAMNVPGVKVRRSEFLRKQLDKHYSQEVIERAIKKNPASAGIPKEEIDKLAKSCISNETMRVTSISAAAGIPGGFAMIGTVPADVAQYFAHIIRVMQKLVYLYGWKEMYNTDDSFDDETMNQLTLFLGVMFGVNAANAAVAKIGKVAAIKVEKDVANRALMKGSIYPIVKKVAEKLGIKMTKQIFARGIGKVVPVVGAVISGGITYSTYRPLANRLKNYLRDLPIADVDFYDSKNEIDPEIIDAEYEDYIDEQEK
ncbi:bacteriochlorophyll 4-vinyl reductase [Alkalihalobacterium elongatum]|uniref:bacteriochlorophyll 4-vinyl reductase n=1 Tax=Alkalihalobacterium elongatum TaxID=2675466 RepID=UPI001C1F64B1|nr:bacteriochlorophyll 4-vinyl reductase [Alkalihalobacterium elongatum]